jgi:hypothetical protein
MIANAFNIITITIFVALSISYSTNPEISSENSLYENLQLVFIASALLIGLLGFFYARSFNKKYALIGLSWLSLAFMLREMDYRGTNLPEFLIYASTPEGSAMITAATLLPLVIFTIMKINKCWKTLTTYLMSSHGLRVILAGSFLVLGGVFDRGLVSSHHSEFFEEFFETAGYYVLAWAMLNLSLSKLKAPV